jgi:hypothetical protein
LLNAWDSIGNAEADIQDKSALEAIAIFIGNSHNKAKAVAPALIHASQALGNRLKVLHVASKFVEGAEGADEAEQAGKKFQSQFPPSWTVMPENQPAVNV